MFDQIFVFGGKGVMELFEIGLVVMHLTNKSTAWMLKLWNSSCWTDGEDSQSCWINKLNLARLRRGDPLRRSLLFQPNLDVPEKSRCRYYGPKIDGDYYIRRLMTSNIDIESFGYILKRGETIQALEWWQMWRGQTILHGLGDHSGDFVGF